MTNTYLTGNPLGSSAPKDLFDNSSNMDEGMNSTSPSFLDRFGRRRQTWAGAEYEWQQLMQNTAFELPPLTYTDGASLIVSRATQLIERAGNLYRVKVPQTFPITLSGTWATDQGLLTFVSDSALRPQLGNFVNDTDGAAIVARSAVVVSSVAKLSGVPTSMGQQAVTQSYNPGRSEGGADYIFVSNIPKSEHDGVITISPTVPFTTRDAFLAGTGETDPIGVGCWKLKLGGARLTVAHGGAYGDMSASDLIAINATLASAEANGVGAVRLTGRHAVNDSVRIPDNVTLWGPKSTSIEGITPWATALERRLVTNADWVNGNTGCVIAGCTLVGKVAGGSQQDHGVHFGKTVNAGVIGVTIKDCQGDGICLGNFVGGVPALCVNTLIDEPVISNCRRMGIAMTCAEGTSINDPYIFDLADAIVGAGIAIDFEPDAIDEPVRNNKVRGGLCRNVKGGVVLSSAAGLDEEITSGNSVRGLTIDTTSGNGILCAFWNTDLSKNVFLNIGQHGVILTSSAGVQGCSVDENKILSCGVETTNNYFGVFFDAGTAHNSACGNIISATDVALTIKTDTSAGFNSVVNNNTRASGKPHAINANDAQGHNKADSGVQVNYHEGFTVTSRIDLQDFGFQLGGVPVYPVTGVPASGTGNVGDVAFRRDATSGATIWYKKTGPTTWS